MAVIRRASCFIFVCLGYAVTLHGDHTEILAAGRPEQVLAGINVYKSRAPETIKRLGTPHSIHDEPVEDAPDAISRDYIWHSESCVLTAGTYKFHGKDGILYFVSVTGCTRTPKEWRTGRGLQLGMTVGKLKALYGSRFSGNAVPGGSVDYEFRDGTTLTVDFDSGLRVCAIKLLADVE